MIHATRRVLRQFGKKRTESADFPLQVLERQDPLIPIREPDVRVFAEELRPSLAENLLLPTFALIDQPVFEISASLEPVHRASNLGRELGRVESEFFPALQDRRRP